MRFALTATSAAAAIAVPFALSLAQPQMSDAEFLSAVRCAAYADVVGGQDAAAKRRLNAEARRQPAETVARAEAEVEAIALQAVNGGTEADAAMIRQEQARACPGAQLAAGAQGPDAV
jgi:hypothetical protein